ncbi:MOSC domain-containing protein [Actinotalea sp. K2]|uniref:MOSC domain-containing protein n=1 Tax=Actinotalea sp. K2 TaxID=2939438 RepID=UPI0020173F66|nr:MOSC domain-containing protein [Actinotalea sp. K2]MCL3859517.1 MOSC domain-containing protein [Actinotalea sp. K2]
MVTDTLPTRQARVIAVSRDDTHRFSKPTVDSVTLIEGWGIEGDAHAGPTVKHRFQVARDPHAPNLRQVHLLHEEVFAEVAEEGYSLAPGLLGENITTRDVTLLDLPTGTVLRLGPDAAVRLTGLRSPCRLIDTLERGLMRQLTARAGDGTVVRKAGVMSVVVAGGVVRAGDGISIELPEGPHVPMQPV